MGNIRILDVGDEYKEDIPNIVKERLAGKPVEQQLQYFSLEYCHTTTCWLDGREIKHPERYRGEKRSFVEDYVILVKDNIIVGLDIGERIYCFIKPYSSIHSYNGHRTSNDGWGYDEEHEWFAFRYAGEKDGNPD